MLRIGGFPRRGLNKFIQEAAAIMYCPHCGYPNSGVEEICPDCGKPLSGAGPRMSAGSPGDRPAPTHRADPASTQKRELGTSKLQAREKLSWSPKKLK